MVFDMDISPTPKTALGRPKDPQKTTLILEAAGQLFLEKGFGATSMEAVAQRAGVSKQTLYSHFGGKDDLFKHVVANKVDHYDLAAFGRTLTWDLQHDLHALGKLFLSLLLDAEAVAMMRVVISEAHQNPRIAEMFYAMGPSRIIETLDTYFQEQQRRETLDLAGIYQPSVLFLNLLKGEWHMQALMGLSPVVSESMLDQHVTACVQQFLNILQG